MFRSHASSWVPEQIFYLSSSLWCFVVDMSRDVGQGTNQAKRCQYTQQCSTCQDKLFCLPWTICNSIVGFSVIECTTINGTHKNHTFFLSVGVWQFNAPSTSTVELILTCSCITLGSLHTISDICIYTLCLPANTILPTMIFFAEL